MDNEDKIVENFFQQMKEIDKTQTVPDMGGLITIEKKKTTAVLGYWSKVAAAVTLLILASFAIWFKPDTKPQGKGNPLEEVVISSEGMEELMSWEEPTKSLLSDF